jgi:Ser/Thr protein kinase RdoA (MazF antagonist)
MKEIVEQFPAAGAFGRAEPWGHGHIHDTYRVTAGSGQFILQRINHAIFRDPAALMDNLQRVTEHLCRKQGERAVRVIAARDGAPYWRDAAGNWWRLLTFVAGTRTVETVESSRQAYEAAAAFGRFLLWMTDLPGPRLAVTIPHFHDTLHRHGALEKALAADARGRVTQAEPEITFALKREKVVSELMATPLPERISHNDCKINNVLFDIGTGVGVCVVDLDTVMHASPLHDFGDLVRATTCPAAEDERDLDRVRLELPLFEAVARGYFSAAGSLLTTEERRMLVLAGKLITFETGIRFLTDHLNGDTYFKIARPGHNLDRCRTQFRLVASIEQQEAALNRIVAAL